MVAYHEAVDCGFGSRIGSGSYAAHSDYETGDDYRVTNTRFNEKDFKAELSKLFGV